MPGKGRGIVDEFLSTDAPDSLDCSLLLATSHGLLVGPSTGAAVHAALELTSRYVVKILLLLHHHLVLGIYNIMFNR